MRTVVGRWLLVALLVAGCSVISEASISEASLQPRPCADVYSKQRCLAMTDAAASVVGLTRDDVSATAIVPDPPPKDGVMVMLGGAAPINVRITLTDGTTRDTPMCMGLASGPTCTDTPRLEARSAVADGGGYKDVPCAGRCASEYVRQAAADIGASGRCSRSAVVDRADRRSRSITSALIRFHSARHPSRMVSFPWRRSSSPIPGPPMSASRAVWPRSSSARSSQVGNPFKTTINTAGDRVSNASEAVLAFDVLWFEKGAVLDIRDVAVR